MPLEQKEGGAGTHPGNNQARGSRGHWDHPGLQYKCPFPSPPTFTPFLDRLCGSYEDLQRGQVSEAFLDFTGGVTVTIKLAEAPGNLWDILTRANYGRTLIGCQTHSGVRPGWALAGCPSPLLPSPSPTSCAHTLVWPQDFTTPAPTVLMFKAEQPQGWEGHCRIQVVCREGSSQLSVNHMHGIFLA